MSAFGTTSGSGMGMIDTQLLERFVARSDPEAFGDLVARHGPAVLRTCRGFLHDPFEAEDAMQATFLVLIQRAPTIRDPELLDRWLVGVARKVAARARRRGAIRSEREKRWASMHPEARDQEGPLLEIRRVVREELCGLPEDYRQPLALCYFEGLTHEEAAERLGWPVGTVKVRLVRARRQLRDRLDRRGVALSVAFLLLLLHGGASATSESDLMASTVEAMTLAASGELVALRANFPRAFHLARVLARVGGPIRWGMTSWIALVILIVSTSGVALAHRIKVEGDRRADASARLARVLSVDCR
jgi:RNA polymerase sigma factor (sigma-70 family)